MHKKSKLSQKYDGNEYQGYDGAPLDNHGDVFCPVCADSPNQRLEVEINQFSYLPANARSTYMVHCAKCNHRYAFRMVTTTTPESYN